MGSDDTSTLLFDVWTLANSTRSLLDDALARSGLSAEEFALYSLLHMSGHTPTALASALHVPPTTMSSILRRLDERGHLTRRINPNDRRSSVIELSSSGRAAHRRAGRDFLPVLARVEAALDKPVAEAQATLVAIDTAVRMAIEDPAT